ncbi:MAG TPA: serine/threonine-protein kinase [Kofleriaceae bacterium]|nr:serine/threonine-protein kinase [Kofleriaceae bacterium]
MKCPNCGTGLEGGARFCGVCGHRLNESQVAAQAAGGGSVGESTAFEKPKKAVVAPQPQPKPLPKPDPHDPYVGKTLNGRFVIEAKLGEGGFGSVYKGTQNVTNRKVAIKLLHPEMTRDKNVLARFRREGQVLCSLRDAHSITTYDFDQTPDGTLFIAMELLEGRSLHDIFQDEAPISWKRMLKVMSEMCSSLEEAHGLGIVHRDLKPENIYLENRPGNPEFVKILDFGIAKVMRGDGIAGDMSPQLTATGQTLGTLEYMSPEQLMGKPLDGRSDIYGLGVVAFEMMTGRLPFPDAVGPAALIAAQLKKVPPSASSAYPQGNIPPEVDALIFKMLEKDKNTRFRDVTELRREIDGVLMSLSGTVPRQAAPTAGGSQPVAVQAAPLPTPAPGTVQTPMSQGGSQPVYVPQPVANHGSAPVQVADHKSGPVFNQYGGGPQHGGPQQHGGHAHMHPGQPHMPQQQQPSSTQSMIEKAGGSPPWLWIALAILILAGGAIGVVLALN